MATFVLKTIIISGIVCLGFTSALEFGRCPFVRPQTDLNATDLVGHWYEYAKYPIVTEALHNCITYDLDDLSDGDIGILKTLRGSVTGIQTGINGYATVSAPGVLNVVADGIVGLLGNNSVVILGSNSSSYAVGFVCQNVALGILHEQNAFILTRDSQPSGDVVNTARSVLRDNGLPVRTLINTDQVNCPENH